MTSGTSARPTHLPLPPPRRPDLQASESLCPGPVEAMRSRTLRCTLSPPPQGRPLLVCSHISSQFLTVLGFEADCTDQTTRGPLPFGFPHTQPKGGWNGIWGLRRERRGLFPPRLGATRQGTLQPWPQLPGHTTPFPLRSPQAWRGLSQGSHRPLFL